MRVWLAPCWLVLVLAASPVWAQSFPLDEFQRFRASLGLAVPAWNQALADTCGQRAAVLAAGGVLTHLDQRGRGPGEQLLTQGFPPGVYGEVLGAGEDPRAVWRAWLASPPHRAVLADCRWTSWGWGAVRSGATVVWVARFQAP